MNAFEKFFDQEGVAWRWNDIWKEVKEHARWKSAKASVLQKDKLTKAQKSMHFIVDSDDDDEDPELVTTRKEEREIGRKAAKAKKAYEKANAAAIAQTNVTFEKFVADFDGRMNAKEENDRAKLALFAESTNASVLRAKAKADKERRKLMELAEKKRETDMAILNINLESLSGYKKIFYERAQKKIAKEMERQAEAEAETEDEE